MRILRTLPIPELNSNLRNLPRLALLLSLLCLWAPALPAAAPQGEGLEQALEPDKKEEEPAKPESADKHKQTIYRSPRAAMAEFLSGMELYQLGRAPEDLARALTTLPEGIEKSKAEKLAQDLYRTLIRIAPVDLDLFYGAGEREAENKSDQSVEIGRPKGESEPLVTVEMTRDAAIGWRISHATLEQVPGWWKAVKDLPLDGEVKELLDVKAGDLAPLPWLHWQLERQVPKALKNLWFTVAIYQWIALALLALICVVLDRVLRFTTGRLLGRAARSERLWIHESEFAGFERPLGIFLAALAFQLFLPVVGLESRVRGVLEVALGFAVSVAGVWAAFRLVDVCAAFVGARARQTANRFDDMLVPLMRRTLKILVGVLGLVYFSSKITDDITGLIAGLSIGSLAVGFAAKDSIENLFGTFTVLLDKPFELGDWITVGEIDGNVEQVGFRSTRIRTFYNSQISVPNSRFISAHVDNWGRRRYRRIKTTLGLTYDTPPALVEAFCEGVRELIRAHPYTRKDYYHVYLNQFGGSSLDVMLYCFVETPDWGTELRERHRLFTDILRLADRLGVEFAFPTQTVHLTRPEDLEHPDAPSKVPDALDLARDFAREVAAEGLAPFGDEKPPPVVID